MYVYNTTQWLLFFYIYCFIGWVWESCYVSAKQRKWVNRGFLHGPMLPIYGSGAIVMLVSSVLAKDRTVLIFIYGMINATLLEYVTGAVMERMFKVRYWDYSKKFLNLHGYICIGSSLAWGVFSVLLVKVVQDPIEAVVLALPKTAADIAALAITIAFAIDLTQSFNEAMDLRATLTKLTESNEDIRRIQKRLEVYSVFAEEDIRDLKQRLAQEKEAREERKLSRREAFEQNLTESRKGRAATLELLQDKLYAAAKRAGESLEDYRESLSAAKQNLTRTSNKEYLRSARILRRNPTATSERYREALGQVRKLDMIRKNSGRKDGGTKDSGTKDSSAG